MDTMLNGYNVALTNQVSREAVKTNVDYPNVWIYALDQCIKYFIRQSYVGGSRVYYCLVKVILKSRMRKLNEEIKCKIYTKTNTESTN